MALLFHTFGVRLHILPLLPVCGVLCVYLRVLPDKRYKNFQFFNAFGDMAPGVSPLT